MSATKHPVTAWRRGVLGMRTFDHHKKPNNTWEAESKQPIATSLVTWQAGSIPLEKSEQ